MKWIKALERLPDEDGFYVYRSTYTGHQTKGIVAYNNQSKLFVCKGNTHALKYLNRVEWLDESETQPAEITFTQQDLLDAFEAGEQRGLSYIPYHGYNNDEGNAEQYFKDKFGITI